MSLVRIKFGEALQYYLGDPGERTIALIPEILGS
jgi:hypothetical protein